jgi:uncharacterized protein DUF4260
MNALIKLEELGMFLFGIYVFSSLPYEWWWFPILILTPDISMVGYLVNDKVGAVLYNIFHHKAIALAMIFLGYYLPDSLIVLIGSILLAHSSMDRFFGYGLKTFQGFKFTHLGRIGKESI